MAFAADGHLHILDSSWLQREPVDPSNCIGSHCLNCVEDRARKGKVFQWKKQCKMFRVEALLGLQA
ncbi:MAG: hypothetical protein EGQ84_05955 [Slackia sp.]|nr:hypothetical protein [Slackia sp.]